MGRFSDKVKLVYLTLVIFFALGVFVYLLDNWGIIKLEEHISFLKEKPALVKDKDDSPSLLEKERLQKERDRLEDLKTELEVARLEIEKKKRELVKLKEELEESQRGLAEEKKKMARAQAENQQRNKLIENMAGRLGAMPPPDAVAIVGGWSNADLVSVFRQMETNSQTAGTPSIVPFLITKLPRERAQIITTLMMDSEASKLPN